MSKTIVCVGGGAASFFAAIHAKRKEPASKVMILEGTGRVLTKVRVSGGGRCNVTHAQFDLRKFASCYPRGSKELLGPLHRFGPQDTIHWFRKLGVELKAEADGRMFPTTDKSSTILDCLTGEARTLGVEVSTFALVKGIQKVDTRKYAVELKNHTILCDALFLGTGSMPSGHKFAQKFGHTITDLAPSLFTFCINSPYLEGLAGVSFEEVALNIEISGARRLEQSGPLLITHWGVSGPSVLKLSAFAARELKRCAYNATLQIDFLPKLKVQQVKELLISQRCLHSKKQVASICPFPLPARFWKQMINLGFPDVTWASISQRQIDELALCLKACKFEVVGKGEFKEEFVTCGGIKLSEVNFKTMESKINPGLFFGGEILDIDGITGGFNFQNAWTGGFIAGNSM